jgi:hypothetical protein
MPSDMFGTPNTHNSIYPEPLIVFQFFHEFFQGLRIMDSFDSKNIKEPDLEVLNKIKEPPKASED